MNNNSKSLEREKIEVDEKTKKNMEYIKSRRPILANDVTEDRCEEVWKFLVETVSKNMLKSKVLNRIRGRNIVILLPISVRDMLARGHFESCINLYISANPYWSNFSDFELVFADNVVKQFDFSEHPQKQTGTLQFYEDTKPVRNPKFIFLVNRNINVKAESIVGLDSGKMEILQSAQDLDTRQNMINWLEIGVANMKSQLIRKFPITTEIYIPIKFILEYDKQDWTKVIEVFKDLNDFLKGTDINF